MSNLYVLSPIYSFDTNTRADDKNTIAMNFNQSKHCIFLLVFS